MNKSAEEKLIERVPPQNLEAEQSLLGCILIDKDALIKVIGDISEDDFYKDAHRVIYETIRELYNNHEPIDILTLSNRLEEKKKLKDIGGRTYLAQLSNVVVTSSNVSNYAEIVQKKATFRRLQSAATDIMELSYREEDKIDEILDEAEKKMFAVSRKFLKNSFVSVDDLLANAFERIDVKVRLTT